VEEKAGTLGTVGRKAGEEAEKGRRGERSELGFLPMGVLSHRGQRKAIDRKWMAWIDPA
jgi:hypothetical protein